MLFYSKILEIDRPVSERFCPVETNSVASDNFQATRKNRTPDASRRRMRLVFKGEVFSFIQANQKSGETWRTNINQKKLKKFKNFTCKRY